MLFMHRSKLSRLPTLVFASVVTLCVALTARPAAAQDVTVTVRGQITEIQDIFQFFDSSVQVGTPYTAVFHISNVVATSAAQSTFYTGESVLDGFTVTYGDYTTSPSPNFIDTASELTLASGGVDMRSFSQPNSGTPSDTIEAELSAASNVFTQDTLPIEGPGLSNFGLFRVHRFTYYYDDSIYPGIHGGFFGTIDSISVSNPPPPISQTHILWTNTDGTASLWSVSPDSTFTQVGFGPYPGWTAKALCDAPDGSTHILWTNTDGAAAVWSVFNGQYQGEHDFGPYAGWTATGLSTGADGTSHLLWDNTDGRAAAWTLDTSNGKFTDQEFGPYPGWTACAIASGATATDLLWTNPDGRAAGWQLAANGSLTPHDFGPYGGWAGTAISVGPDDGTHLLWTNANGRAAVWGVSLGTGLFTDLEYGPYSGWAAKSLATSTDDASHLLWTNTDGRASLWTLGAAGTSFSPNFGPYPGWAAVAVSAGP